jgi:hypothetical protein
MKIKMEIAFDDISPALTQLIRNASCEQRHRVLATLGSRLSNEIKRTMADEKSYDGKPMRSPSKTPRPDGKFAESYKWRYREGYVLAKKDTRQQITGTTYRVRQKKGVATAKLYGLVRRRVPVTATSKQLQDTGATIKSVDILSADCNRATVGPKTGHGQKIIGYHNDTRRPLGISDSFADRAAKYVFDELMKGV